MGALQEKGALVFAAAIAAFTLTLTLALSLGFGTQKALAADLAAGSDVQDAALAQPAKVKASAIKSTWKKTCLAPARGYAASVYIKAFDSAQPSKVVNKNPSIAKLKFEYGRARVYVKKPGNATIGFNYRGKRVTLKLKVVKWTAPFASLKIGTINYTKLGKHSDSYWNANDWFAGAPDGYMDGVFVAKLRGKLTVKTKNGWKVTSMKVETDKGTKKVKNGYVMKNGDDMLTIYLKNSRNGATGEVPIGSADW